MEEENKQHNSGKKPRKWSFSSETNYNNLVLSGLSFEVQEEQTNHCVLPDQSNSEKKMKKIEKLIDPKLLPKARSRKEKLDNKLLLYVNPIETSQRVITKFDKEAKLALFAHANLQLDYPPHIVLLLNSGDATTGLALALAHPQHTFHLLEPNASRQRLSLKNINANEETIMNTDLVTEIVEPSYKSIIVQVQPYTSKSDVFNDIITTYNALVKNGNFYLLTRKQQGGEEAANYVRQIFGKEDVEIKKGMGGYMLISAIKKSKNSSNEDMPPNNQVEFQIFGETLTAETLDSLFSKEGLDKGTRLLLESTRKIIVKANKVLDLGCGWGAISMSVLKINPNINLTAIDVLPKAVQTTKQNLRNLHLKAMKIQTLCNFDPRQVSDRGFDLVLSNPPYHERTDILIELFKNTMSVMQKGGGIYIVVENTYLDKFVDILGSCFGKPTIHATQGSYTILKSKK